jgi:hypothetical protein
MILSAVRIVLISLIVGWLASVGFGMWMARLQYLEIYNSRTYNVPRAVLLWRLDPRLHAFDPAMIFAPDRVATEYQWRVEHILTVGAGLILPQVLVVMVILAWLVMRSVQRRHYQPVQFGAVTGGLAGIAHAATILALHTPPPLAIGTCVLMVGVGIFAALNAPVSQM